MTKLINPSDDQLNAAFAEKVAGLRVGKPTEAELASGGYYQYEPSFTTSADAVLPYLRKSSCCESWHAGYVGGSSVVEYVEVQRNGVKYMESWPFDGFARAAVIALLRAHGVEVKFMLDTSPQDK